jgi:predicted nuclease of predicted toxin-antitoxin system
MKILADENIPRSTVEALREFGHEVLDLRGSEREGSTDGLLWQIAQDEERLLVTTDKGFSGHRGEPHFGILIVRLKQPNRQKIHDRVMRAMSEFAADQWPSLLVVMRDEAFGIWRAPENQES